MKEYVVIVQHSMILESENEETLKQELKDYGYSNEDIIEIIENV